MLLCCSYSYFLSTASISMGIRPAMIHTASSDTVLKALDTLRALSQLTAAILSIEVTTEAKSFLRGWRCPPMFGISLANALATLAALAAAYCTPNGHWFVLNVPCKWQRCINSRQFTFQQLFRSSCTARLWSSK